MTTQELPAPARSSGSASSPVAVRRLRWLFIFASYAVFIHAAYLYVIQRTFEDSGLYLNVRVPLFSIAIVHVVLCGLFCPIRFRRPTDLILFFVFIVHIVPTLVLLPHYDAPPELSVTITTAFALICIIASFPRLVFENLAAGYKYFYAIFGFLLVATFANAIVSGALKLTNVSLFAVYELRFDIGQLSASTIFAYTITWAHRFYNIAFMAICAARRKWFWVAFFVGVQGMLFVLTQEKIALFTSLFVVLCYAVFIKEYSASSVIGTLVALITFGIFLQVVTGDESFNLFVVRRILYVPAGINGLYYVTFESGPLWWPHIGANLWGAAAVTTPAPALVVGTLIGHSVDNNAGVGFIGSGYMNAGYAGILLYGFILGIAAYLLNCLVIGRMPLMVGTAAAFGPLTAAMIDADLPTAMLTHGLFIALAGLYLLGGVPMGSTPNPAVVDARDGPTASPPAGP